MSELNALCLGVESGTRCANVASETYPVPLCTYHRMQVAISIAPQMLAAAVSAVPSRPKAHLDKMTRRIARQAKVAKMTTSGVHQSQVYFIANGSRVKIGFTANLRARLEAFSLRTGDVLLLLEGGRDLEGALHRFFAELRIDDTEWFHRSPEIDEFIASKNRTAQARVQSPYAPMVSVDLPEGELIALAGKGMGEASAVHLRDLLAHLHTSGHPAEWTVYGLRRAYESIGVTVRRAVRGGPRHNVNVGIHRDDLLAHLDR